MIVSLSRTLLLPRASRLGLARINISKVPPIESEKYVSKQIQFIRNTLEHKIKDWNTVKAEVLAKEGSINEKNLDAVLLRLMVKQKKFDAALSFADHIKNSDKELNIGSINGLLLLYAQLSQEGTLKGDERSYILNTYSYLYDKYKVLDSTTCELLLHALCAIDEWEKAIKVLNDILLSSKPTHSAYSTLIASLFRANNESKAKELIAQSLENKRPLQLVAYKEWIKYIFRQHKDRATVSRHLQKICEHIAKYCETVNQDTANLLKDTFLKLEWNATFTRIRRENGQCTTCKDNLKCLKVTEDEFQLLLKSIKDRLIVGSDLFLKSSPQELKRFLTFVEKTGPYDFVFDALNIAYSFNPHTDKLGYLSKVVEHFRKNDKNILLLGRKHMLRWPRINHLVKSTCSFFTDNLSQDDPYFISAAILSGPHTDVVSKDLLRGHLFLLRDERLQGIFQRWQWQHQWMVYVGKNLNPCIEEPLSITPIAQKTAAGGWHLPFAKEGLQTAGQVRDGTPDWNSWICLQPPGAGVDQ